MRYLPILEELCGRRLRCNNEIYSIYNERLERQGLLLWK